MTEQNRSRMDRWLDLLVEEVAERLQGQAVVPSPAPPVVEKPAPASVAPVPPLPPTHRQGVEALVEAEPPAPFPPSPPISEKSHAARLMGRLSLGLLILVVLINVPFNRHGTTLATAMPDARALIIRDGLIVKEASDARIYVYQNGAFRWISSLDAFDHYGYTWGDVHIVESGFMDDFEIGAPLHVLLKCYDSPHIYRLEDGTKRWIVDIEAFEAEGHVWEDVRFVSCEYLRQLPDGETIPPGQGPPPQP
ncbi:MAG: hypothetical protein JXD18_04650 [Anaerolineae bacterium]|nr:hypothetical protein [Anaerolineae bacterium]